MKTMDDIKRVAPLDEQADFVMSFVDDAREKRQDLEPIWDETELSFLVRPFRDTAAGTSDPLDTGLAYSTTPKNRIANILKDPETHQQVMSLAAKIVLKVLPEGTFAKARGVGFEDIFKGTVTSDLIQYACRLPNHFMAMLEWVIASGCFGTGILEAYWLYREELRDLRSVEVNEFGDEEDEFNTFMVPVYDDVCYETVDVRDFFPDPGNIRMAHMMGAAKRFKISALDALRKAEQGLMDEAAVKDAIDRCGGDPDESRDKPSEDPTRLSHRRESHADFAQMTGFEYYGETPFKTERQENLLEPGVRRRRITVLSGITVRSRPWNFRVPFFDLKLIPRLNSFWGIAPAEVIRHDQDFADMMKMMLADAVVRMTHPPMIYNKYGDVDYARLMRYRPEVPVGADLRQVAQPVYQLQYNPQLQPAFGMYQGTKQQMRETTGEIDPNQGLGLGSKRFSATEALETFQAASARPDLYDTLVERGPFPELLKYTLELYQRYIDTPGLQARIGDTEARATLADILPEYDIEAVGSREQTRAQALQSLREIAAASANPIVGQLVPWIPLLQKWFRKMGQDDIAAMVGNPELTAINVMMNQLAVGGKPMSGNDNGTTPAREPLGILPQQAAGDVG